MAIHRRSRAEEVEEEGRHNRLSRQDSGKVLEATDSELAPPGPVTEDPAALLTSPQAAHPANAPRHAQAVRELQQQRGNAYVQHVMNRVQAERGGGQPLDTETKADLEGAFGQDFDDVRIHTGPEADSLTRALGARSFTTEQDIFVRSRESQPQTQEARRLLRHEAAHVIQQREAGSRRGIGHRGDPFEREARSSEQAGAEGVVAALQSRAVAPAIQKVDDEEEVEATEVQISEAESALTMEEAFQQETEFNGRINGIARSMINAYCIAVNSAVAEFAAWAQENTPATPPSILPDIIDAAFALIPVPGAETVQRIFTAALNLVKSQVVSQARTATSGAEVVRQWQQLRTSLSAAQQAMAANLQSSNINLDFMNQLRQSDLEQYRHVHDVYSQLLAEGRTQGMDGMIRQFLIEEGFPADPGYMAREILANLITEIRFASARTAATTGFRARFLPGLLTGEARAYRESPSELRRQLHGAALSEAGRRLGRGI